MRNSQNLRSSINGVQQSVPFANSQQLQPITTTPLQQNFQQMGNQPLRSSIYETPKVNKNVIVGQSYVNPVQQNEYIQQLPYQSDIGNITSVERIIQKPAQVTQILKERQRVERVVEQMVPGDVQQVHKAPQIIEKEVYQNIPGEIIEKVIEKIVPQIQIEERIIEVEKPVEVIVVKERKGPKRIKEKIVEKSVQMHRVVEIPGKEILIPKHTEVEYETEVIETVEKPIVTTKVEKVRNYAEERRLKKIIERLNALLVPKIKKTDVYRGEERSQMKDAGNAIVDPFTQAKVVNHNLSKKDTGGGFGGFHAQNQDQVNQDNSAQFHDGQNSRSSQQANDNVMKGFHS